MFANSRHVAARIERHYGRTAEVIYPPVDVPEACQKELEYDCPVYEGVLQGVL